MKKFFVGLMALAVIISCGREGFPTQIHDFDEAFALADGREDSLTVSISVEYPAGPGAAAANITKHLNGAIFGEKYLEIPVAEAIKTYAADMAEDYRTSNAELMAMGANLNYADAIEASVAAVRENIVSYFVLQYSYTGGAHGMTMETAYNFDITTGEPINEEDIFKPGYEAQLNSLLNKHLPEAFEDPAYMEGLFVTEIQSNGNFNISDEGITYIYNRYEIAPYAAGAIRVTIPWTELSGIVK